MKDFNDTYLGVVEDNQDPERKNRCRVRVINIFDGIPTEDIPWANPYKNSDGTSCNLPDIGKVVSVIFENGDIYNPVYKFSEHYNPNLEQKLDEMSQEDYLTMKALLFDHMTQVYRNDSEGLVMDHKFNKMTVTNTTIDMLLKNNLGRINIGTKEADQQMILGNNFLDWFDKFVDELLGANGGAFLGNLGAPVITSPGLSSHLMRYKAEKTPKFLSHNIFANDNGSISDLSRYSKDIKGDNWRSIKNSNSLTREYDTDYSISYKTHISSESETENDNNFTTGDFSGTQSETPNADLLRRTLLELGYVEKGRELSNGGDITNEMALYSSSVFRKIKELYPEVGIRVTSGNDAFHQRLSYNSRHKRGNAVDFVISPVNKSIVENIDSVIRSFVAGGNGRARFLNEYDDPTKAATGYHFHLSWGYGTEGQNVVNQSIAQSKSGDIPIYLIA